MGKKGEGRLESRCRVGQAGKCARRGLEAAQATLGPQRPGSWPAVLTPAEWLGGQGSRTEVLGVSGRGGEGLVPAEAGLLEAAGSTVHRPGAGASAKASRR